MEVWAECDVSVDLGLFNGQAVVGSGAGGSSKAATSRGARTTAPPRAGIARIGERLRDKTRAEGKGKDGG